MNRLADLLREERVQQGLTIQALSDKTKIRARYIEALEEGQFHELPTVYMKSFVKTIAQALHIPVSEVTALLDDEFEPDLPRHAQRSTPETPKPLPDAPKAPKAVQSTKPNGSPSTPPRTKINTQPRLSPMIMGLIILSVVGAGILAWRLLRSPDEAPPAQSQEYTVNVDPQAGTDSKSTQPTDSTATLDSMQLKAVVMDTAWITITSDNKRTQQTTLHPGTELTWSAMNTFTISLGNAGGVSFTRDGVPLKPFGRKGEVVRQIVITRNDVTTTSQPPKPTKTRPSTLDRDITTAPVRPRR